MRLQVKLFPLFLLIFFCAAIFSCNGNRTEDSKDVAEEVNDKKLRNKDAEKDAQFLVDATAISYDQTRLAGIALTNGTGDHIKNLATQLKEADAKLIDQLNNIAGRKAITLPTEGTEKMLKDAGAMVDKTGKDFNKQWLDKAQQLHVKQLKTFEDASGNASDSTIREWFIKNLPVIQQQKAAMDSVAMLIAQ